MYAVRIALMIIVFLPIIALSLVIIYATSVGANHGVKNRMSASDDDGQ